MAPVVSALKASSGCRVYVLATAQHREMLDQVLRVFGLAPDYDLNAMMPNQSLAGLTGRLVAGIDEILQELEPDAVLAQGDTTTVLCAALAAYYRKIPFGHVEAGLRTGDMANPFPEEMNRVLAARLTKWHFAPTESARENLLAEGYADADILVTGNTVIDALLTIAARDQSLPNEIDATKRLLLVTSHRRENFGAPLVEVCEAIREIADQFGDVMVLYPVHPNPNVQTTVRKILSDHPRIRLVDALDYESFVAAMKAATLIISDSGGVQEEAPALGKPVLVLRDETERPEAVNAGVVRLVGTDKRRILAETTRLLTDPEAYRSMARGISPYGDGCAASRIVQRLLKDLAE